jgi:peptide/nickel transport system permease protein
MKIQNNVEPAVASRVVSGLVQKVSSWPFTLRLGVLIVGIVALMGIFAPLLTPYDPIIGDFNNALAPPGLSHPFGTDSTGRDIFSRTLFAARLDLQIGLITTYVPFIFGLILGTIAGYFGGWFDVALMRLVDIAIAFPFIVLIIVILAILGPGIQNMYIAVFLLAWTMYARLTRAEMLVAREQEYIMSARALGYPPLRIIFRHALPNVISSSVVFSMSDIVLNILLASAISFLGLGVQPPTPEWGAIVTDGRNFLLRAWWISTLPGIAIIITGLGFSLIGDGLARLLGQRNIQTV